MLTAIEKLGEQAKAAGVPLRQSYARVAKRAALMAGRYAHAKQFKRMNRALKFLRTRLVRLIRDLRRKTAGDEALEKAFAAPLSKAMQIRSQRQQQRGWKLHSWHAPETECIGKGKTHKPWEFGCKVSIATTNRRCKAGQFVVHAKASHGNPYDGHTLRPVIEETQGAHRPRGRARLCRQEPAPDTDPGAIAATTPRKRYGSSDPAKNAASRARSNANSGAAPPSRRQSAT